MSAEAYEALEQSVLRELTVSLSLSDADDLAARSVVEGFTKRLEALAPALARAVVVETLPEERAIVGMLSRSPNWELRPLNLVRSPSSNPLARHAAPSDFLWDDVKGPSFAGWLIRSLAAPEVWNMVHEGDFPVREFTEDVLSWGDDSLVLLTEATVSSWVHKWWAGGKAAGTLRRSDRIRRRAFGLEGDAPTRAVPREINGPLAGFRWWELQGGELCSPFKTRKWAPGEPTAALHSCPSKWGAKCECGLYAFHALEVAIDHGATPYPVVLPRFDKEGAARPRVLGAVSAWGGAWLHRDGFRSEAAAPLAFLDPVELSGAYQWSQGWEFIREKMEAGSVVHWMREAAGEAAKAYRVPLLGMDALKAYAMENGVRGVDLEDAPG